MKKNKIFLGFLLVVILLAGLASAEPINITDCQDLDIENAEYILQNDIITTDSVCFDIQADGITLDLNGYDVRSNININNIGVLIGGKENIIVKNGIVSNFSSGIKISSSNNILIENNYFRNNRGFGGVYLIHSNDNTIMNNYFEFNDRGILIIESSDNLLIDNYIAHNDEGFRISYSYDNMIKDTIIQDSKGFDFYIETESDNHCNNFLENVTGRNGKKILFYNYQVNIDGIDNATEIILCNADNSIVKNVVIDDNRKSNGFLIVRTDNSVFSNLYVRKARDGISLWNGNNNVINNSIIKDSFDSGIEIFWSNNNEISKNKIVNNSRGIKVFYSGYNVIINNRIKNNLIGLVSVVARDNLIYNNFILNVNNLIIPHSFNNWNINLTKGRNILQQGYSVGGNFWGKPDGTGFSQTCDDLNHDGICDSAYSFNDDNADYFPLTYFSFSDE